MKKLMIAAAIVCAAVASQAAQINWRSGGIKDFTGASYSGAATLVLTDVTAGKTQSFSGTFANGSINTLVGDSAAADAGFVVAGHVYSGYFTMTDANKNVYTSATKSNVTAAFPSNATFAIGAGSWEAAPEPTSGLLLLLGMAGLALKRRRA